MDAFGHVNNVEYLRYLEEARVDMLFTHAQRGGGERLADGVVVARHEIDYKRPLVFRPEPVRIETWVTLIRHASFGLGYEVRDDDVLYARASSLLVPYDRAEHRPRRLSQEERAALAEYLEPPQG
ncbi:MAG: acyl-CoA thioesterase [Sporichthyaceae bacterium]|nr:acyl-CoA thioesterase [Sporichthyaceae bacterium]